MNFKYLIIILNSAFNLWAVFINTKFGLVVDTQAEFAAVSFIYLSGIVWMGIASSIKEDEQKLAILASICFAMDMFFTLLSAFSSI